MSRSQLRCTSKDNDTGVPCKAVLGAVDRYTGELRLSDGVVSVAHGVGLTMVCPVCGKPRVFSGWTMTIRKVKPNQ